MSKVNYIKYKCLSLHRILQFYFHKEIFRIHLGPQKSSQNAIKATALHFTEWCNLYEEMIQHVFNYRSGIFLCVRHSQHWRNIFPTPWLLLYDPNSHVIIRLAALWRGIDCCNERKLKLILIHGDHHATCQSSRLAICANPNCVVGNALQVVNLNSTMNHILRHPLWH